MVLVFWCTINSAYAHCIAQQAKLGIVRGHTVAEAGPRKTGADGGWGTPVGLGKANSLKAWAMLRALLRQILADW